MARQEPAAEGEARHPPVTPHRGRPGLQAAGRPRRPEGNGFPPHHHRPGRLGHRTGQQPQVLGFSSPWSCRSWGPGGGWVRLGPDPGPTLERRGLGTHLKSQTASLREFFHILVLFYLDLYICIIRSFSLSKKKPRWLVLFQLWLICYHIWIYV